MAERLKKPESSPKISVAFQNPDQLYDMLQNYVYMSRVGQQLLPDDYLGDIYLNTLSSTPLADNLFDEELTEILVTTHPPRVRTSYRYESHLSLPPSGEPPYGYYSTSRIRALTDVLSHNGYHPIPMVQKAPPAFVKPLSRLQGSVSLHDSGVAVILDTGPIITDELIDQELAQINMLFKTGMIAEAQKQFAALRSKIMQGNSEIEVRMTTREGEPYLDDRQTFKRQATFYAQAYTAFLHALYTEAGQTPSRAVIELKAPTGLNSIQTDDPFLDPMLL